MDLTRAPSCFPGQVPSDRLRKHHVCVPDSTYYAVTYTIHIHTRKVKTGSERQKSSIYLLIVQKSFWLFKLWKWLPS